MAKYTIPRPLALHVDVTSGTEKWFRVKIENAQAGSIQYSWQDATNAFDAPSFYVSNFPDPDVPADGAAAPDLEQWVADSGISGTSVTAGAAGSRLINWTGKGAKWLLMVLNPTATVAGSLSVYAHTKD